LLEKRIFDWAKIFKEKFPNKSLEMVTNGSLLFPDTAKKVYDYFDIVHVSLNAFSAETHRVVSNTNQYEQIFANLMSVAKDRKQREKTIVRFIRQKANFAEKKDFFRFWHKMGFMAFGFDVNDRLKDVKDFKEKINVPYSFGHKIKLKFFKFLGKILLPTCPIPFLCIYIKANGDIVQCFNDWSNSHILANIKDQTISDVYSNEKYAEVRKKLFEDRLDENVICSKCDLYKEGIWLTA
jgi:radical SAM protein with 4Fe4S-binding SPASM domain